MSSERTLQERLAGQSVEHQISTLNAAFKELKHLKNKKQLAKSEDAIHKGARRLQQEIKERYDLDGPSEGDPLQLTLGTEMEFVLLRDTKAPSKFDSPATPEHDIKIAQRAVHDALSQPIYQPCEHCGKAHVYNLPLNTLPDEPGQPIPQTPVYRKYDKWTVATDGSVDIGELRKEFPAISIDERRPLEIQSHGIEVKSRILSLTDHLEADATDSCAHRPAVTYQDEITAAYELLRKVFLDPLTRIDPGAWCLLNNEKGGLHVHIGNGVSAGRRGFPLATVKNVVSMTTANERAIDNLHAKNRIGGTTIMLDPTLKSDRDAQHHKLYHDVFNEPFSAHFGYMAYANRIDPDEWLRMTGKVVEQNCFPNALFAQRPALRAAAQANDAMSWLRVVNEARKIEDLRDLHAQRHHFATVKLGNLKPDELRTGVAKVERSSFTNTIEFRQAAGTIDPVAALAWVDVVVKLVEHCHNTPQATMFTECVRICQETRHHTLDFLATIGLGKKDADGIAQPYRSKSSTCKHYKSVLGFGRERNDYATRLRKRELATAAAFDDFKDIRVANAHANYKLNKPKAVNKRIEAKFLNLCFGQFTTQYLKDFADPAHWPLGHEALLPKLTIGWTYSAPATAASDQEPNPQDEEGRFIEDTGSDEEADKILNRLAEREVARAALPSRNNNLSDGSDASSSPEDSSADTSSSDDSENGDEGQDNNRTIGLVDSGPDVVFGEDSSPEEDE